MDATIFLSYPRPAKNIAASVADSLRRAGFDVFMDVDSIDAGASWKSELWDNLRHCDGALVFIGATGLRPWQQREVELLLERHRTRTVALVPVLLSDHPADLTDLVLVDLLEIHAVTRDCDLVSVIEKAIYLRGRPALRSGEAAEAERLLARASGNLLGWPRGLLGGRRLPLGCEDAVLHWASQDDGPPLGLVLGAPGSGKSGLLAEVGNRCRAEGRVVVAIKADMLPESVADAHSLSQWLKLSHDLGDVLAALGRRSPTLLIIDQLDALAGMVDLHTHRLNAMLALIREAAGLDGIRVLTSCRSFDFKHDQRFGSMGPVETFEVEPLSWTDVSSLLREGSFEPEKWSEEARKVLRTPQQLALFLQVSPGQSAQYDSYHAMLDAWWRKQVTQHKEREVRQRLLWEMAREMARKEVLWVPTSRYEDTYGGVLGGLLSDGVLKSSPDTGRIGFSHQTLFEYVRSRMFVSENDSLLRYVLERQDGLAVRPVVWNALHYLRRADRGTYESELQALLGEPGLRRHVRDLVLDFLGQVAEPTDAEAQEMVAGTSERRAELLARIAGSPGWFQRVKKAVLPSAMAGTQHERHFAVGVLAEAMRYAPAEAIALVQQHWGRDEEDRLRGLWTLERAHCWGDDQIALAASLLPSVPLEHWIVSFVLEGACKAAPDRVLPLLRALLSEALERARAAMAGPARSPLGVYKERDAVHDAAKELAGVPALMSAVTALADQYAEDLLGWLVELADLSGDDTRRRNSLSRDGLGDFLWEYMRPGENTLVDVALRSVLALARQDAPAFLALGQRYSRTDRESILTVIARGMCFVARAAPDVALRFLEEDPRRLGLVDDHYSRDESADLVEAIAGAGDDGVLDRCKSLIQAWSWRTPEPDDDADLRRYIVAKNRDRRVHLLRRVPVDRQGVALRRWLREEERALGERAVPSDSLPTGGVIGPAVTAGQMALAMDDEVVRLFDPTLTKRKRRTEVDHFYNSRLDVATRELTALAKTDSVRGLRLVGRFMTTGQWDLVEPLLMGVAEAEAGTPRLFGFIASGQSAGISEDVIVVALARAARTAAEFQQAPPRWIFGRMVSWVEDTEPLERGDAKGPRHDEGKGSVLFAGSWTGSFCGTLALVADGVRAFLAATQEAGDVERWLDCLCSRLRKGDTASEWCNILMTHWPVLVRSSAERLCVFVDALMRERPDAAASMEGAALVFRALARVDGETVSKWLDWFRTSGWARGPQAFGECLMARHLMVNEEWSGDLLIRYMEPVAEEGQEDLRRTQLGIAFVVAEGWHLYPDVCNGYMEHIGKVGDVAVVEALARIFLRNKVLQPSEHTRRLLDLVLVHEPLLAAAIHSFLTRHLADLLAWDVHRVASVATAAGRILAREGASFNSRNALAGRELLKLSHTLQRMPGQRKAGMELFEMLREAGVYGVDELLADADRRIDRPPQISGI